MKVVCGGGGGGVTLHKIVLGELHSLGGGVVSGVRVLLILKCGGICVMFEEIEEKK